MVCFCCYVILSYVMSSDVTMLTDWSIKDFNLAHWAALENVKKGINVELLTVFSNVLRLLLLIKTLTWAIHAITK